LAQWLAGHFGVEAIHTRELRFVPANDPVIFPVQSYLLNDDA